MRSGPGNGSFGPGFMKLVFQHDQYRLLRIPQSFVKHMIQTSKKAILTGPSGSEWHVQLKHDGRKMYFSSGWDDFANEHCLQETDLLVFLYEGNNKFHVSIFNGTACSRFPRLGMSYGSVKGTAGEQKQRGRPPQPLLASGSGTYNKDPQHKWQPRPEKMATKNCQMGAAPVKRKRGRPRKNPLPPAPADVADSSESEPRMNLSGGMPYYDPRNTSINDNRGAAENYHAWDAKGGCSEHSGSESSWNDTEELYSE